MTAIEQDVQEVFAELTRYPMNVLEPDADLEDELGIDSVKRGEILVALQKRFGLGDQLPVPIDQMTTIRTIAQGIESAMDGTAPPAAGAEVAPPVATAPAATPPIAPVPAAATARAVTAPPAPAPIAGAAPPAAPPSAVAPPAAAAPAPVARAASPLPPPSASPIELQGLERRVMERMIEALQSSVAHLTAGTPAAPPRNGTATSAPATSAPSTGNGAATPVDGLAWARSAPASPAMPAAPPATSKAEVPFIPAEHKPFAGRVALVTGSGHGLGRNIALELARLGATVAVNSFHARQRGEETAEAIRAAGGEAVHLWGSVAQPDQLHGLFKEIESRFGYLDFFVSNASNGIIAPLDEVGEEHWERAFRTNVVALHRGALLARDLMRPRGGGKIVALSSPGAQRYIEHFGCMGPVKAAVESLTRYLAIELGPDNIQVNAVSAGPVYGELLDKYPDSGRLIPHWESVTVGQRLASEDDITDAVILMLTPATRTITGSVLLVDRGGSQRI